MHVLNCSVVSDSATPWTVAPQAPLTVRFSRQDSWSGLPCPFPGDLPHPGMEPTSLRSPVLAGGFFTPSATWKPEPSTWVQHQKCQGDLNSSISLLPRPLIRRWRPKCRTPSSAVLTVSESLPHTGLPLPPPPPPLHWPRIHFHPTVTPAPHCHSTALLKSLLN